jgi:dihydroorotase
MSERILFRGARVIDPASGRDEVANVLVADGEIAAPETAGRAQVLDCSGLVLAPGLVDPHTHLREPGREDKETVETGCRAAALGGFTAVAPMANADPVRQRRGDPRGPRPRREGWSVRCVPGRGHHEGHRG